MPPLRETQTLFWDLIRAPEGVRQGLAGLADRERRIPSGLDAWIRSDGRLSALDRLDIYANMYFFRLLDVLQEDFPAVRAVLGDVAFHNLVTAYLVDHPSTHPSVRYVGRHLPAFVERHEVTEERPWLYALARLEWARVEAFDGPDAAPLDADRLRAIAPDEWARLRFRLTPTLEILRLEAPVHEAWQRAIDGEAVGPLSAEPTTIRVWRKNREVLHRVVSAAESTALDRVLAGETFAAVCDAVAAIEPVDEAARSAARILQIWFADGLVVGLD